MRDTGRFFAKLVVVIGFIQLATGTIGALIWGLQDDYGVDDNNLPLGLAFAISNLLVSSLFISSGAYIALRIEQMPDSPKKAGGGATLGGGMPDY